MLYDTYTEERITKDIEYESRENSGRLRLGVYENDKLLGSVGIFPYKVLFENKIVKNKEKLVKIFPKRKIWIDEYF